MSERLRAIVDDLPLTEASRVLEIGCGHGVAASFVCARLGEGGFLAAIDRSPKMIAVAERRNAEWVRDGTAEFLVRELENLDLGERRFDLVFAVRVGLLHREPKRGRQLIDQYLAPGGVLRTYYD